MHENKPSVQNIAVSACAITNNNYMQIYEFTNLTRIVCLRPQAEQQLRCSSVRPKAPLLHALPISRQFNGNANFRTWSAGSCTLPSSCLVLYGLHNRLECTKQPQLYICRARMRGALQDSVASCLVSAGGARSDRPVTHVSQSRTTSALYVSKSQQLVYLISYVLTN